MASKLVATMDEAIDFVNKGSNEEEKEASSKQQSWDEIIGDRTAEHMKKETAIKFSPDKKSSNAYKRLMHLQTLFKQINASQSDEEKSNDDDDDKDAKHDIFKPIDDVLDITRGYSKPIGDEIGIYAISSEADFSLDCNFNLKDAGKWYYEVELIEDPTTYKDLNIGFANSSHSARNEIGFDSESFGYNGCKNKLFNMNTDYGKTKWKTGDILGFALDFGADNNVKIEFYLNGESQGIAFDGIDYSGNGLFAGLTLQKGQNGVFIYDETKLKSKKPDGYSCINIDNDAKQEDVWKIEGDMKLENVDHGIKITSNAGFPTALLSSVEMTAGNKYYFEFELSTAGCMQLGFADSTFKADPRRGTGIGDDSNSWGCDLLRMQKWGIFGKAYCNANWTKGDIIGCSLDLDNKTISYSLNGKDLGVAFEDIKNYKDLFPAISVRNIGVRNKMIELYQQKQTAEKPDDIKMPEPIIYFNLIFCEKGYKYKPNGYVAITENVAFKAMDICNGLKEYSYDQYAADYCYMDTVIMLEKDEEFDEIVKSVDSNTLIVCDFWATWCGPCIYIAPHYHEISEQFPNVVFLKADVDKLKTLSSEKGIQCMPTFKFFKDGQEVHKIEGADKDSIIEAVKKYSQ